MTRLKRIIGLMVMVMFTGIGCKEPFTADALFPETNFLVVEGFINVGSGETKFTLSRTVQPESGVAIPKEHDAVVRIEDNNSNTFGLQETGDGIYTTNADLPYGTSYRLLITTKEGKEYASSFVAATKTPPIDSVFWTRNPGGVDVYVATHGDVGSSPFYQWEFEATWEIRSTWFSELKYEGGQLLPRFPDEMYAMYTCYAQEMSQDLQLFSTMAQSENRVSGFHLLNIIDRNERLAYKYSVLVKQHTLSREGFDYLQLMKKNTGPLGSFSDPQPAELVGNIVCLNSNEPVVGYIEASSEEQERIFILNSDIPDWNFDLVCEMESTTNNPDSLKRYLTDNIYIPIKSLLHDPSSGRVLVFSYARDYCVDCHVRNGDSRKPDFWD